MSLVFVQTEGLKFSRLFMTFAFLFDRSTLGQTNRLSTTTSSLRRPQIQINSPKYRGLTYKPASLSSEVWNYTNKVQKEVWIADLTNLLKNWAAKAFLGRPLFYSVPFTFDRLMCSIETDYRPNGPKRSWTNIGDCTLLWKWLPDIVRRR